MRSSQGAPRPPRDTSLEGSSARHGTWQSSTEITCRGEHCFSPLCMGLGPRGEGPETWEKPPRSDSRGSPGTPAPAPLACRRARLLDPGCRCFPWAVGARAAPLHLSHSPPAREARTHSGDNLDHNHTIQPLGPTTSFFWCYPEKCNGIY